MSLLFRFSHFFKLEKIRKNKRQIWKNMQNIFSKLSSIFMKVSQIFRTWSLTWNLLKSTSWRLKIQFRRKQETGLIDNFTFVDANCRQSTIPVYKSFSLSLKMLHIQESLQISELNKMLRWYSFGIAKFRCNKLIFHAVQLNKILYIHVNQWVVLSLLKCKCIWSVPLQTKEWNWIHICLMRSIIDW